MEVIIGTIAVVMGCLSIILFFGVGVLLSPSPCEPEIKIPPPPCPFKPKKENSQGQGYWKNYEKRKDVQKMSEEKRTLIVETVKNLRQMDKESLMLMKSGSELLKARDALDSKEPEK